MDLLGSPGITDLTAEKPGYGTDKSVRKSPLQPLKDSI